jgi:hypothetical protein
VTDSETTRLDTPPGQAGRVHVTGNGDLTEQLIGADFWSDDMVAASGMPIIDVPFISVGGGIGSFVMVDYLRIAGVPRSDIRVLTNLEYPWQTYEYLTRNSQIPPGERLRSDSASTPDNIWGFPSYALREAFGARSLRAFIAPLWQVLTEPILTDYYTPRAGQVFAALERESQRISYPETQVRGLARVVRRRSGGGYFTVLTPPAGSSPTKRVVFRSTHVHIAVGYPGLKFLPDLQQFRQQYPEAAFRVVNAYEPHEHVYEELKAHPSTVVLRGGGIVASRILQRLIDDRDHAGAQTTIIHLFRTCIDGPHGPNIFMRRKGGDGWAYQGFNYPKSAWGGQLKNRMRQLEGADRADMYKLIGGTNTPIRQLWQQQLKRGRKEGFYSTYTGEVEQILPAPGGRLMTRIRNERGILELPSQFIIDGTGLEADIAEHRLLADLLEHTGAGRNPLNRLDVERSFELRGTRNGAGRMYGTGAATLGGYFPGVDTFLGLQIASQEVCDDLASIGFCRRIGIARSTAQWWRWAGNRKI